MTLIRNPDDFRRQVQGIQADAPSVPSGLFLVAPAAFRVDPESAEDNRYLDLHHATDPDLALRQFHALAETIAACGVPAVFFSGHRETPDAVFTNNVFGTAPGRYVVGSMRHRTRRKEAERVDIRRFFDDVLGREPWDLSKADCIAELTGSVVMDRGRRIGFCGLSNRADLKGAALMHEAFDMRLTFAFNLRPTEYHTNVVMSVLAGRAVLLHPPAITDPGAADVILDTFERSHELDDAEIGAFAGNCLAINERDVLLSERAADGLRPESRAVIEGWGFRLHPVDVSELERAGGSVRCMLGEIF